LALLLLSVLALCITACSTRTAPVPQPVAPFEETDGRVNATQREVERTVFDAQRAGFEQRDLAGYMAAWAEDARLVAGRTERAGPHDVTLTRSQIEATKRVRFPHLPELTLSFEVQHFEYDGKAALLRTLSTLRGPENFVEQNVEVYRLRREAGSWKVHENRYWPVRVATETEVIIYGDDTWQKLDTAVEATASGTLDRVYALLDAFRVHEAYTEITRLTTAYPDYSPSWYLRYQLALRVGDVEGVRLCNESIARLENH
jgi:hypothetical protein